MLLAGAGRVAYSAYVDFVELYDPKVPGDDAMCQLALKYMESEPEGDHAKLARALWTPAKSELWAPPVHLPPMLGLPSIL